MQYTGKARQFKGSEAGQKPKVIRGMRFWPDNWLCLSSCSTDKLSLLEKSQTEETKRRYFILTVWYVW